MRLLVYGDFNCPFSALASARAADLEQRDIADIEWRAIQHDPAIPPEGELIAGRRRLEFERELEQIRGLLVMGEPDRIRLPQRYANTRVANEAYAAAPAGERCVLREQLFSAYWSHGSDLSNARVVEGIAGPRRDEHTAQSWQDRWSTLPRPIVPALVLSDGYITRGLGALARLEALARRTEHRNAS